jgi:hypothetical protein
MTFFEHSSAKVRKGKLLETVQYHPMNEKKELMKMPVFREASS